MIEIYIKHVDTMGNDLIFAAVTKEGIQLAGALGKDYTQGRFALGLGSNKKHYLYEAYSNGQGYKLIDSLDDSKDPSKEIL